MHERDIERVRVCAVGPDTERHAWATDPAEPLVTNTIARITTRGGMEGVAGAMSVNELCFSSAVAETMRPMVPHLIGASALDRGSLSCATPRPTRTVSHGRKCDRCRP